MIRSIRRSRSSRLNCAASPVSPPRLSETVATVARRRGIVASVSASTVRRWLAADAMRDVPIPRSLIDALVAQAAGKKPEDVLFNSPSGEPIRLANWRQRAWDPAVAAAGLTGLTPHDLRHTAASLAIASGASVKHVQRMLGHKDAAMTLNVYASLFEDDMDDVSNRLDAALLEAAAACVRPEPRRRSSNCLSAPTEQRPD